MLLRRFGPIDAAYRSVTVKRDWRAAKKWHRELTGATNGPPTLETS
jgi:hypothetical protein